MSTTFKISLALFAALLAVPFVPGLIYPVFVMKVLCYGLFACAFNLLLGFTGLVSFAHASHGAAAKSACPSGQGVPQTASAAGAVSWVAMRTGRLLIRSARRRRRCRSSPTTPRRKNETQTMKIKPITTVTRSPMVAR